MTSAAAAIHTPPTESKALEFVMAILGYIALALAIPFVALLGGPHMGWLAGAALFTASFAAQRFIGRVTQGMEPTHAVGLSGITSIGRAMVVVLILFVVALKVDETIGLVAGGVFAAAFTFDLMGRTIIFAIREKERKFAKEAAAAAETQETTV